MSRKIDELAKKITKDSSVQTYWTTKFLVDRDKQEDSFKAYAYLRWIDDQIDEKLKTKIEGDQFMQRQKQIIQAAYEGGKIPKLADEERMVVELIIKNKTNNPLLKSFLVNFIEVIDFDAGRKHKHVTTDKLEWYSDLVAKAVTDGIMHFIDHDAQLPTTGEKYLAARGAHITHMLRDMYEDEEEGFINVPGEYLKQHNLKPLDVDKPDYRLYVKERVEMARKHLNEGKKYIDRLRGLRVKIAAYWYCARFEPILDVIERDNYRLREDYDQYKGLQSRLRAIWLAGTMSFKHIFLSTNINPN
jgi:phytoene/squalene synthetase